jgi:hypothetical protein
MINEQTWLSSFYRTYIGHGFNIGPLRKIIFSQNLEFWLNPKCAWVIFGRFLTFVYRSESKDGRRHTTHLTWYTIVKLYFKIIPNRDHWIIWIPTWLEFVLDGSFLYRSKMAANTWHSFNIGPYMKMKKIYQKLWIWLKPYFTWIIIGRSLTIVVCHHLSIYLTYQDRIVKNYTMLKLSDQ